MPHASWTPDFETLKAQFDFAIAEDIGDGDHSALSSIPAEQRGKAQLIIKESGVFAGGALAAYLFKYIDATATVKQSIEDGALVEKGTVALIVEGNTIKLLQSERLVLNYLQRLSGIATRTYSYAREIDHTECIVLDTRKTTPGLRVLEKWAVALGGGGNHRMGLYDAALIKENHISSSGSIKLAVSSLKEKGIKTIEVEVESLEELQQAIDAQADIAMLDNFAETDLEIASEISKGKIKLEISGNIGIENLNAIKKYKIDYISSGDLTKNISATDYSLIFRPID